MRSLTSDPRPNNLLFLNYSQDDIIFGFHEKFHAAILQADREYHPEVLFLITSCLQEIVGEDFDSYIDEIRPHVKARLLIVHTENFTCEGAAPGVENIFKSLFELMTPQPREEKTVNILGLWTFSARNTELARLLNGKGIGIKNVIPSYCTPSDLQKAPEVQLNIVLDQYALPLAKMMKDEFGTDYVYCRKPYMPDSIENWYQDIAGALNIDLSREIADLKKITEALLSEARCTLCGKTCAISGAFGRPFDLALLLSSIGLKPRVIFLQTILPEDRPDIQRLLAGESIRSSFEATIRCRMRSYWMYFRPTYHSDSWTARLWREWESNQLFCRHHITCKVLRAPTRSCVSAREAGGAGGSDVQRDDSGKRSVLSMDLKHKGFPVPSDYFGVLWALSGIKDLMILEHGSTGTCSYNASNYMIMNRQSPKGKLFSSGMDEDDVVMGRDEKIKEAISELDGKYHPEGDRTGGHRSHIRDRPGSAGIIEEIQPATGARLLSFSSGGFAGDYNLGIKKYLLFCTIVDQRILQESAG